MNYKKGEWEKGLKAAKDVMEEAEKKFNFNGKKVSVKEKINGKKEMPAELEVDFLIDNYTNSEDNRAENDKKRLKELFSKKPGLLEESIKRLENEGGYTSIKRDLMNDQNLSREKRDKAKKDLQNKMELLKFLHSL